MLQVDPYLSNSGFTAIALAAAAALAIGVYAIYKSIHSSVRESLVKKPD